MQRFFFLCGWHLINFGSGLIFDMDAGGAELLLYRSA
jgi:hypothetical protein